MPTWPVLDHTSRSKAIRSVHSLESSSLFSKKLLGDNSREHVWPGTSQGCCRRCCKLSSEPAIGLVWLKLQPPYSWEKHRSSSPRHLCSSTPKTYFQPLPLFSRKVGLRDQGGQCRGEKAYDVDSRPLCNLVFVSSTRSYFPKLLYCIHVLEKFKGIKITLALKHM